MKEAAYLTMLAEAFRELHGCDAIHIGSVPIRESFQGQAAWDGEVEIFSLQGHPKAKSGYAWATDPLDSKTVVAVLGMSPVDSPRIAVQAAIASGRHPR